MAYVPKALHARLHFSCARDTMGKGNHIIINCQTRWQRVCVIFHVTMFSWSHSVIVCDCISEVFNFTIRFPFRLTTVNRLYTRRKYYLNVFVLCICVHIYMHLAHRWLLFEHMAFCGKNHAFRKSVRLFTAIFQLFGDCVSENVSRICAYMSSSPLTVAK